MALAAEVVAEVCEGVAELLAEEGAEEVDPAGALRPTPTNDPVAPNVPAVTGDPLETEVAASAALLNAEKVRELMTPT